MTEAFEAGRRIVADLVAARYGDVRVKRIGDVPAMCGIAERVDVVLTASGG